MLNLTALPICLDLKLQPKQAPAETVIIPSNSTPLSIKTSRTPHEKITRKAPPSKTSPFFMTQDSTAKNGQGGESDFRKFRKQRRQLQNLSQIRRRAGRFLDKLENSDILSSIAEIDAKMRESVWISAFLF
jgi:hypothetical protein